MEKEKREYIKVLTQYLFYKYIYSVFLEEKYISNFASLEIEKMESIYETFLYDKAIENRFMYGFGRSDINFEFENTIAKKEYKDLKNQINSLKSKKENNSTNLDEIKKVLDRGILNKISEIIEDYDPYLNYDLDVTDTWNIFIKMLREKNFEYIFELFEKNKEKRSLSLPKDINKKILYYVGNISKLSQYFPYNMENTLSSKTNINQKISEIKDEINKSKETLKRITNVYLFTEESKGLES